MIDISSYVSTFPAIHLEEAEKVKLFQRMDKKYTFSPEILPALLDACKNDYFILEVNNYRLQPYISLYFDTPSYEMYRAHHGGRPNRFKLRQRNYVSSGVSFLEVKHKIPSGETIKSRIGIHHDPFLITEKYSEFVQQKTPYNSRHLQPQIFTNFDRITLVSKKFNERVTLDINLFFEFKGKKLHLPQFVIAEVKQEKSRATSPLAKLLHEMGIKSIGLSKYCLGMALMNSSLKRNLFKPKLLYLQKIAHDLPIYPLFS